MIELTEQQCLAVKNGQPIRVLVPELGSEVVLFSAELFEKIRVLLEEEEDQKLQEGWQKLALKARAPPQSAPRPRELGAGLARGSGLR